jgi:hypothetical protein
MGGIRPRTKRAKRMKAKRCPKCGKQLAGRLKRCYRCNTVQPKVI